MKQLKFRLKSFFFFFFFWTAGRTCNYVKPIKNSQKKKKNYGETGHNKFYPPKRCDRKVVCVCGGGGGGGGVTTGFDKFFFY